MKRPSFQFYPADWRNNAKLRRCSWEARGCWLEILCLMHDSEEYGILRWSLKEIVQAIGASMKIVRELVEKGVIRGSDKKNDPFIYTPRHANKDGIPVQLIAENEGPCWFSSRMVVDEYVRQRRGCSTRFVENEEQPNPAPKPPLGYGTGEGPTSTSTSTTILPKSPAAPSERGLKFADWFRSLLPVEQKLTGEWRNNWGKLFDDLIRLDGRTPEAIKEVCVWARKDSFWSLQFFTPIKLRKPDRDGVNYFDAFTARMKANGSSVVSQGRQIPAPDDPLWGAFLEDIKRPGEWTMRTAPDYLKQDFRKWKATNEANPIAA